MAGLGWGPFSLPSCLPLPAFPREAQPEDPLWTPLISHSLPWSLGLLTVQWAQPGARDHPEFGGVGPQCCMMFLLPHPAAFWGAQKLVRIVSMDRTKASPLWSSFEGVVGPEDG